MKKLISVLMALCLLCVAAAAVAEAETPTMDSMPQVVTVDEGVELTDADFEGDWVVSAIFVGTEYVSLEQAAEMGILIQPLTIADGKIKNVITDEEGEHEVASEYTLENNQILYTDGQGIETVFEKLEDGNIVLSIFLPSEGETPTCVTYYLVHPEA